jgi:hypothetical protein
MRAEESGLIGILILGMFMLGMSVGILTFAGDTINVPKCQEDEIFYGTGDFDAGVWESYLCIPLDDLAQYDRQMTYDQAYSDGYTHGRTGQSFGGD